MTTTHQIPLRIPVDVFNILRAEAAAKDTSLNALVVAILGDHVASHRAEILDVVGEYVNERYNTVLEKLADL